jgi:hypothetical protein
MNFSPVARFVFWTFVANFFILTWLGACPAEEPFTGVSQFCSVLYFVLISSIAGWSHVVTYFYLGSTTTLKSPSFVSVLNL